MAVRIRMKRLGRRKRPFYRLVAIDSKTRREGAEVERLGWYDPLNKNNHFSINEDRVRHWLGIGAKASYAAKGLFKKAGLSYKWHLEKNGTSKDEVIKLLEEWHNRKSLKAEKLKEIPVIKEAKVEDEVEVTADSGDVTDSPIKAEAVEESTEEAKVEDEASEKESINKKEVTVEKK